MFEVWSRNKIIHGDKKMSENKPYCDFCKEKARYIIQFKNFRWVKTCDVCKNDELHNDSSGLDWIVEIREMPVSRTCPHWVMDINTLESGDFFCDKEEEHKYSDCIHYKNGICHDKTLDVFEDNCVNLCAYYEPKEDNDE